MEECACLALALSSSNQPTEALEMFEEAESFGPDCIQVKFNRTLLLLNMDQVPTVRIAVPSCLLDVVRVIS